MRWWLALVLASVPLLAMAGKAPKAAAAADKGGEDGDGDAPDEVVVPDQAPPSAFDGLPARSRDGKLVALPVQADVVQGVTRCSELAVELAPLGQTSGEARALGVICARGKPDGKFVSSPEALAAVAPLREQLAGYTPLAQSPVARSYLKVGTLEISARRSLPGKPVTITIQVVRGKALLGKETVASPFGEKEGALRLVSVVPLEREGLVYVQLEALHEVPHHGLLGRTFWQVITLAKGKPR